MPKLSTVQTESNCFGCAPSNPIGLRLQFTLHDNVLATRVILGADYESFRGIVHGGIVASILDEILARVVYCCTHVSAFTTALRVRYGRPMRTGTEHLAYAEITRNDEVSIQAAGRLELPGGELVAAAEGTFCPLTEDMLRHLDERLPAELICALRASNEPLTGRQTKNGYSSESP